MRKTTLTVATAKVLLASSLPLSAQNAQFNLTYHIERTPTAELDIETCGQIVVQAAAEAGFQTNRQSFPDQLVLISGGAGGRGVFTVQCIAVKDVTVSVVQGIDYGALKGSLGNFADIAHEAILAGNN